MGGEVRPQALESADSKFLGLFDLFAVLFGMTIYAIYDDLRKEWPKREEISPHSAEVENVVFDDHTSGALVDVSGVDDPLRSQPLNVDATLDNFFSRPLKIHEQEWGVGSTFSFKINPWQLYFENPRVINRISNYKLMKARLHIKVMLNGNAFHYGRVIVAYNPLPSDDNMTVDRAFIDADVVEASQRPHIWLNPTCSEGGEMEVPFFYYKNLLDIVAMEWRKMGELDAHSLQSLKHANGATDTVTVSVFAWATDVAFSIPTQVEPGAIAPQALEIEPQADEYGKKPVSRIAGAVAKIAGRLTDMPVIGMYAKATEIGATALGAMATLFGFSKPIQTETVINAPRGKADFAVTNVINDSAKLSVDVKQELSIDPRTVGLSAVDEMTIQNIATRESYLAEFDWDVGTSVETLLWQAVVDPSLHRQMSSEKHFTALAFATMPFKYWRGSLRFRFMVVCSAYHKGRLKIVYDPEGGIGTAEYNTAYTTLVDISNETDFTIDVGWGQATSWREHRGLSGNTLLTTSVNDPLGYTASSVQYGNGTISVYVVNELTVPNTTTNNDIQVNVFVSALDDYEVSVPTEQYIQELRLTKDDALVVPQAEEYAAAESEPTVVPTDPVTISTMANKIPINDPSSLIHFGEAIGSLRQLLKRYQLYEFLPSDAVDKVMHFSFTRAHYPMFPGYVQNATALSLPNEVLTDGTYNFVYMTYIRYISCAYAGMRGGMRYALDLTPHFRNGANAPPSGYIHREYDWIIPASTIADVVGISSTTPAGINMNQWSNIFDGAHLIDTQVNPIVSFELPYYSKYRFKPAKHRDYEVGQIDEFQDSWTASFNARPLSDGKGWCSLSCSAAEDFSCYFFLGTPIFYVERTFPID